MTWILLIIIGGSSPQLNAVEFNTRVACEEAKHIVQSTGGVPRFIACVEKGEK